MRTVLRIDPEPPRRRPLAQPLDLNRISNLPIKLHVLHPPPSANAAQGFQLPDFYSGATDQLGRFTEGFSLRRLQPVPLADSIVSLNRSTLHLSLNSEGKLAKLRGYPQYSGSALVTRQVRYAIEGNRSWLRECEMKKISAAFFADYRWRA